MSFLVFNLYVVWFTSLYEFLNDRFMGDGKYDVYDNGSEIK